MVYFNRKSKKIISVEFAEDNDEEDLERVVREDTGGKEWSITSSGGPPEPAFTSVKSPIIELGKLATYSAKATRSW